MLRYPFPWRLLLDVARDLPGGRRSLADDARLLVSRMRPPPVVTDTGFIPLDGPVIFAANHYQRRGLWIGWAGAAMTLAVAEQRDHEHPIHWLVTGGLRLWQPRDLGPELPFSRSVLGSVARLYGMNALPLSGSAARAGAIRSWIRQAERGHALGFFPEGLAGRSEGLRPPPEAVAALCDLLFQRRLPIVPVGVFEQRGGLHVRFGPPISQKTGAIPGASGDTVMRGLAALIPPELGGPYSTRPREGTADGSVE
jgi:hypothetical protein